MNQHKRIPANQVDIDSSRQSSIALIGMRGSGKTSVGRTLSSILKLPHVDTDDLIVHRAGQTIAEIFRTEGEGGFRVRESQAVVEAVSMAPAVISVGGGAVVDPLNVERLRAVATVIWLDSSPDILWRRMSADPSSISSRPPLTGLDGPAELVRLFKEREPFYARAADITIDTNMMSIDQLAQLIRSRVQGHPRTGRT